MRHYVTVLESSYLPFLLCLHGSMQRHAGEYTLWVVSVDERLRTALGELDLTNVRVIPVEEIENDALRQLRRQRGLGQYCWTLTPLLPQAAWRSGCEADVVTYIDADMFLLASPEPAFDEFDASQAATMLTPHAFTPSFDASKESGIFCVQFMPFRRHQADHILEEWARACMGQTDETWQSDQKFLDYWPRKFGHQVHVLERVQLFLGPWNMGRFPYSEAVAFHFHGLRFKSERRVWLSTNPIPTPTFRHVYRPYLQELADSVSVSKSVGVPVQTQSHHMGRMRLMGSPWARIGRALNQLRPGRSAATPTPQRSTAPRF